MEFVEWPKIGRLFREVLVTEKLDGTNAAVHVDDDCNIVAVQSRSKFITPGDDNYGFAAYVYNNVHNFAQLGPGVHHGEWAGKGIQKRYSQYATGKTFWLFNAKRWSLESLPEGIDVVPTLYEGTFYEGLIEESLKDLEVNGSVAYPDAKAEGIVVYWPQSNQGFKVTLENDGQPKGQI